MRYADTDTLCRLNERAAEDGLMWADESFFDDLPPDGVYLCDWATPFGEAGTSSHFMTVWRAEKRGGEEPQLSMNVRREDLLALAEIAEFTRRRLRYRTCSDRLPWLQRFRMERAVAPSAAALRALTSLLAHWRGGVRNV
jgi:hypothetical protein